MPATLSQACSKSVPLSINHISQSSKNLRISFDKISLLYSSSVWNKTVIHHLFQDVNRLPFITLKRCYVSNAKSLKSPYKGFYWMINPATKEKFAQLSCWPKYPGCPPVRLNFFGFSRYLLPMTTFILDTLGWRDKFHVSEMELAYDFRKISMKDYFKKHLHLKHSRKKTCYKNTYYSGSRKSKAQSRIYKKTAKLPNQNPFPPFARAEFIFRKKYLQTHKVTTIDTALNYTGWSKMISSKFSLVEPDFNKLNSYLSKKVKLSRMSQSDLNYLMTALHTAFVSNGVNGFIKQYNNEKLNNPSWKLSYKPEKFIKQHAMDRHYFHSVLQGWEQDGPFSEIWL